MNTTGPRVARNYGNPVMNFLTIAAGAVALVLALSFGLVLLGVFAIAAVILGSIVSLRVWWFKRQLAKSGKAPPWEPTRGKDGRSKPRGVTIESEYEVVKDDPKP